MDYLCYCDYEGTLTGYENKMSEYTIQGLKDLLKKNKLCVLSNASLKQLKKDFLDQGISCDFFSISSSCGRIKNQDIIPMLDSSLIQNIISNHKEIIYTAYMAYLDEIYIYNYKDRLLPFYPEGNLYMVSEVDYPISNITIAINKPNTSNFYKDLETYKLPYKIIATDIKRDIVFISKFLSKGELVPYINTFYPEKTTVGIGDSLIDYDFISKCDITIAMKNSDEKLKQLCNKTTKLSNLEDGCIKTLQEL